VEHVNVNFGEAKIEHLASAGGADVGISGSVDLGTGWVS